MEIALLLAYTATQSLLQSYEVSFDGSTHLYSSLTAYHCRCCFVCHMNRLPRYSLILPYLKSHYLPSKNSILFPRISASIEVLMSTNCTLSEASDFVALFSFMSSLISFNKQFSIGFNHSWFQQKVKLECCVLNSRSSIIMIVWNFTDCLLFFLRESSIDLFSRASLTLDFHPFN